MTRETQNLDQKSLRVITGSTADWSALAADCVCFANASGGCLRIGVEDGQMLPPAAQRVPVEMLDRLRKRIGELTVNVQVAPTLVVAENGGECIDLVVARSIGVASTVDGRYFLRVGDACKPVVGDDVLMLLNDRPQVPWETMRSLGVPLAEAAPEKVAALLQQLRDSDRVKDSVKDKGDAELLTHYGLSEGGVLTHLGVLLVGRPADRARLGSAPVVQAIKYDELGQKVNKWLWADYLLSPMELVEAIWVEIPDFHESYELPDGLLRQKLPAYDPRVVRELLVNALVHRPYTQRGDIFLNLHPDRLEVVNPGRLPLGVTPQNILHASRRRNERLATLFHDVRLMEKEGSGFDLMYDIQLSQGRSVPVPKEGPDSVCVTVGRRVLRVELVKLMADADARFQLRPRERICLGLLAASEGLTARELASRLELAHADELQSAWLGRLLSLGLVQSSGKTQATRYFVAPALLKGSGLDGKTTLRRMEPHRLRALIVEDLARYPDSSSGDINRRVGPEVPYRSLKRALDELTAKGQIQHEGLARGRRYRLRQD
ncbi:ATP-binding protein [uncultured Pseudacidovorax sp.]|uniref:ATP-binding protein n=1 Tax=uncultured Pseudacidovorax sp. TaxID=679313 RepID=UPI0025CE591F|nr:ATP-binding protein [uncultured Pseudacidovorax sp.]